MWWWLWLACAPADDLSGTVRHAPGDGGGDDTVASADDTDSGDSATDGPCPAGMALVDVDAPFCVDRYEGALEEEQADGSWAPSSPYDTVDGRIVRAVPADHAVPQGYISGAEAGDACERSGKRLCTSDEWLAACQGPDGFTYPYGDSYDPTACNDTYEGGNGPYGHPVEDLFDSTDVWDMEHMNDPRINQQPNTVDLGGAHPKCESAWGAFDMHGNLHEWVADADGKFRGGFYADAKINGPGCLYVTTAHEFSYHDYSTGFRCCADPR